MVIPSVILTNWRLWLGVLIGFALCWPVASCSGKREANAVNAAKVQAAAEKVKAAATQAELAATLSEMVRDAKTKDEIDDLREVVEQAPAGHDAGPAVAGVLGRLREANRR